MRVCMCLQFWVPKASRSYRFMELHCHLLNHLWPSCLSLIVSPLPPLILFSYSPVRIAFHPSSSVSPLFYLWLCTERWTPVIWRWCKVTCNLRHKIYTSKWCKPRARILHFLPLVHQHHSFFSVYTAHKANIRLECTICTIVLSCLLCS